MSTIILVIGGVILCFLFLLVVVGTFTTLGKLIFLLEYHFHQLQVRQNLRFYHKTKAVMINRGVVKEDDEKLYRFYIKHFNLSTDLEITQKTQTVVKDCKEVQETVSVLLLNEHHSESESESMNELTTPEFLVLIWYGILALSILTFVSAILLKVGSLTL